jgi:hypothetical protein
LLVGDVDLDCLGIEVDDHTAERLDLAADQALKPHPIAQPQLPAEGPPRHRDSATATDLLIGYFHELFGQVSGPLVHCHRSIVRRNPYVSLTATTPFRDVPPAGNEERLAASVIVLPVARLGSPHGQLRRYAPG